jgi:hypothetical protein
MLNLNSPIVSGLVVAFFMSVVSLIMLLVNMAHNKRHNSVEAIQKALESKVDKENCGPAMQRIGKQIDKSEDVFQNHSERIVRLEATLNK